MNRTAKIKTAAAMCAEAIRKELKIKFPEVKFKVTSETYSGGNSVNVSFTDSKHLQKEVEEVAKKYQEGHFDGMTDSYEYSNRIEGLPQVKFVFVDRSYSEAVKQRVAKKVCANYGVAYREDYWNIWDRVGNNVSISSEINYALSQERI